MQLGVCIGMVQLEDLPVEIIWHVIKCLGYARDVSHLSLACKGLYSIVVKDGYQLFVQDAFPTISIPAPVEYAGNMGAFFKDAAHSLTTLSRNWDRKAFIAHHALPFSLTQQSRHGGQSQQTMGFTPAIDSHETWYGNDWRDRYQVLVCGAGSRLYIRLIDLGKIFYPESRRDEPSSYQQRWETYNERGTLDGRDDIVAVKLLPQASRNRQHMVVARTSGDLAIISFDIGRRRFARDVTFDVSLATLVLDLSIFTIYRHLHDAILFFLRLSSFESSPIHKRAVWALNRCEETRLKSFHFFAD